jgi:transposase
VLSTQSTLWRHTAIRLPSKVILGQKQAPWPELCDANVRLGVQAHRATIKVLNKQIEAIEGTVLKHLKPIPEYKMLLTVPGIGPVIAWTIVLEAGDLSRFTSVGHFASYCRCVDSRRTSNDKKKGENNAKNGNSTRERLHSAIQSSP